MKIDYRLNHNLNIEQLARLYKSNNWSAYTDNLSTLKRSVDHSLFTVSAFDGHNLVGLIRVVGDGYSIIYIQDLLVHTEYQNQGIGKTLVERVLRRYSTVRQVVLLTDKGQENYYEKLGFSSADDLELVSMVKIRKPK